MKKFVAILLAITLITTCVACSAKDMTSGEFKTEFNKFDWENSAPTAVAMEADRLLDMLDDLPAETQKELSDVKEQLEDYKLATKEDEITEDEEIEDHLGEGIVPEEDMENGMQDGIIGEDETEDDIMDGDMLRRGELNVRRRMLQETIGKKAKPEKTQAPDGIIAKDGKHPRPERLDENGEVKEGKPHHPHHRPHGECDREQAEGEAKAE